MRVETKQALRFPRGDYRATVIDSIVTGDRREATLYLRLAIFGKRASTNDFAVTFRIHHPDARLQFRERVRLQTIASAIGVSEIEDSDQLHGRPFMLTIWNAEPLRFSCRPASEVKSGSGARCPASMAPDDEGPRAA